MITALAGGFAFQGCFGGESTRSVGRALQGAYPKMSAFGGLDTYI